MSLTDSVGGMSKVPQHDFVGCSPEYEAKMRLREMEAAAQAEQKATFDNVQRPEHYASGGVECIDAIAAAMTVEQFRGYLRGNTIKYLWRYERKGGVEDLRKAGWYLDRLTRSHEERA